MAWIFLADKYDIPLPSRGKLIVFLWAALACLFVGHTVLRFVAGETRTAELTSKALERLVRLYQRVSGTA